MRHSWMRLVLSLAVVLLLVSAAGADITTPIVIKWSQLPNMAADAPDYSSTVSLAEPTLVADDFLCTLTGPLDSVHWWGSLMTGDLQPDSFTLYFTTNVPAGASFSHPGELLWSNTTGQYQVTYYGLAGDEIVYQYYVDMSAWGDRRFAQTEGTIYWLGIAANYPQIQIPGDGTQPNPAEWGWHEAATQWGDDAVYVFLPEGGDGDPEFQPIERQGISRDLAFELDQVPEPTTLALLGLGLAGIGLKRRKHS